uniref:NADH-ubiquinone oxidoreductase chain 3 n=1 Tax=Yuukianura szeptyckii TaxID=1453868 RepID=A0A7T0M4E2_9HEXA|nr:NADH dehydrogenase subunit 3 [Yuukianura szeptyckii]QPL15826.1 NADH dehydrogenase subunit 3 [Yuukianura szeptyckii]
MFLIFILALFLPFALMSLNLFIFKKKIYSRNKPSPFECGFDPKINIRSPFSLKFYLISIIFLIFDIEIALILPIPVISSLFTYQNINLLTLTFMLILFFGLVAEWKEGALKWLS